MAELVAQGQGIFELVDHAQALDETFADGEICQVRIDGPVAVPQDLLDMIRSLGDEFGLSWYEDPRADGNTLVLTIVKHSPFLVALGAVLKFVISNAIVVAIAFLIGSFAFQFLKLDPREAQSTMNWVAIGVVGIVGLLLWNTLKADSKKPELPWWAQR